MSRLGWRFGGSWCDHSLTCCSNRERARRAIGRRRKRLAAENLGPRLVEPRGAHRGEGVDQHSRRKEALDLFVGGGGLALNARDHLSPALPIRGGELFVACRGGARVEEHAQYVRVGADQLHV